MKRHPSYPCGQEGKLSYSNGYPWKTERNPLTLRSVSPLRSDLNKFEQLLNGMKCPGTAKLWNAEAKPKALNLPTLRSGFSIRSGMDAAGRNICVNLWIKKKRSDNFIENKTQMNTSQTYSHLNAEDIICKVFPELLKEIREIIRSVDASSTKTKPGDPKMAM